MVNKIDTSSIAKKDSIKTYAATKKDTNQQNTGSIMNNITSQGTSFSLFNNILEKNHPLI